MLEYATKSDISQKGEKSGRENNQSWLCDTFHDKKKLLLQFLQMIKNSAPFYIWQIKFMVMENVREENCPTGISLGKIFPAKNTLCLQTKYHTNH